MTLPRETLLCEYRYDPLDRLVGHDLPDTAERQCFYCKSRLATEVQGAARYSIVQQGDQLLAEQQRHGDSLATTLLATDLQRSVLQTIKPDHSLEPIAYSPYGHRPVESGLLSLLGFNGERPDPVTGHYLLGNGYRAFNPVLLRFNSPDSLSPFGEGGLNPYAYCLGDPINWNDQTGRSPLLIAFMKYKTSNTMPATKLNLGPKAKAQLAKWRRPKTIYPPHYEAANRDISSLKAVTINYLTPDKVLPHAKTSSALRNILETTDPFNFENYEYLKNVERRSILSIDVNKSTYALKNETSKIEIFSRSKSINRELLHITSKILEKGGALTAKSAKAHSKNMAEIRENFSELPYGY